jgi:predicted lysophospholipase L1 biosynthesis ABC-type transport system permease subunit
LRAELQRALDRIGRLAADNEQSGADARDLAAAGTHVFAAIEALDRHGRTHDDALASDPGALAAQLITAALMAAQLVEEMAGALASASARIEAVPVKADLLELTARMDTLNQAFQLVSAAIVRNHVALKPAP